MPVSFQSVAALGAAESVEDVTVSRISPPRHYADDWSKRAIPRKTLREIKWAPNPIERTLRQRQRLQPSASDPSLMQRASFASPMASQASFPRIPVGMVRSVDSAEDSLKLPDVSPGGSRPVLTDNWLGLLTGDQRVDIPFRRFTDQVMVKDTDKFVNWYRTCESERQHEESQKKPKETPEPQSILPWEVYKGVARGTLTSVRHDCGHGLYLGELIETFDNLEDKGALRNPEAVCEAMLWKAGSLSRLVDWLSLRGNGLVGLMEFTGICSILLLDVQMLCAVDESTLHLRLDPKRRGVAHMDMFLVLGLKRYMKPPKREREKRPKREAGDDGPRPKRPPPPEPLTWGQTEMLLEGVPPQVMKAREKWAHIARWMGLAAHRGYAMRQDRRCRGWTVAGDVPGAKEPLPVEPGEADNTFMTTTGLENSIIGPVEFNEALFTKLKPMEERPKIFASKVLLITAWLMREQDRQLKIIFRAAASVRVPGGPLLLSKTDFFEFFRDLHLADPQRAGLLTPQLLERLYDEACTLQCDYTKVNAGLSFWSLKAVLSNLSHEFGLGYAWRPLSEYLISTEETGNIAEADGVF
eukprot:TRINITY_DN41334_c0_g1_i1.p1 TRINITY_DN41334_c0_g1~~TRINITY_DN41334_c0_g1_i1.p1  ORF type:complete len:583 (-),score=129.52 TRINITY_DN41334_c0_g1_i1:170-1918(-)